MFFYIKSIRIIFQDSSEKNNSLKLMRILAYVFTKYRFLVEDVELDYSIMSLLKCKVFFLMSFYKKIIRIVSQDFLRRKSILEVNNDFNTRFEKSIKSYRWSICEYVVKAIAYNHYMRCFIF